MDDGGRRQRRSRLAGTAPLAAPQHPVLAIPTAEQLAGLSDGVRAAFTQAVQRMLALGASIREVDLTPFLEAGRLLYGGGFVAERYAAVGAFVDAHRDAVDPTVGAIISAGRHPRRAAGRGHRVA